MVGTCIGSNPIPHNLLITNLYTILTFVNTQWSLRGLPRWDSFFILHTVGIELKYIKDNDLAMGNKNFTLTYDELLLLLKDAYRNGYATYEMTGAGLEPYDDDGYARWVLLGMESNKIIASNKDKDIFFNELLNPSEPNKALKDAAAKYKMKKELKIYRVEFKGMYPVGNCLVLAAFNQEQAEEMAKKTITHTTEMVVNEMTINEPQVIEYLSGDY